MSVMWIASYPEPIRPSAECGSIRSLTPLPNLEDALQLGLVAMRLQQVEWMQDIPDPLKIIETDEAYYLNDSDNRTWLMIEPIFVTE